MIYGYLRVSTGLQDAENQKQGVIKFAEFHNMVIDEYILDDGVSGTKDYHKRELGNLLDKLQKGDILISSEISRLGRNIMMIFEILNSCIQKGVTVYTVKDNFVLRDDIQSKVLAFAFGLSAEIERDLISQRTKEALQKKKADGVILGRPIGVRCRLNPKCCQKADYIKEAYANGMTKIDIAKEVGVSICTLYRYMIYTGQWTPKNCTRKSWVEDGIFK